MWSIRFAPCCDVQQLHADADAEHRHATPGDEPHQHAVVLFAARVERTHGGMQHEAVAARIQIGAADQHHAVEQIEHAVQIILVGQRRQDQRNSPGIDDRIIIAGADERVGRRILLGATVIGVQSNQGLRSHKRLLCGHILCRYAKTMGNQCGEGVSGAVRMRRALESRQPMRAINQIANQVQAEPASRNDGVFRQASSLMPTARLSFHPLRSVPSWALHRSDFRIVRPRFPLYGLAVKQSGNANLRGV